MRLTLRNRILLNFGLVIAAFGLVGGLVGAFFIDRTTVEEEQRRVGVDLRSAWSVLQAKQNELSLLVNALGPGKRVAGAFLETDPVGYRAPLEAARIQFKLDFLGLTDGRGRVILRATEPYITGDDLSNDPLIGRALTGQSAGGFQILGAERLRLEGSGLEERAFMVFEPTPKAKPRAQTSERSGLAMLAAAPVKDHQGRVFGTIYAGVLLNRNHALVDQIRSLVFEGQLLDGRPVGTVTIFQWDVRVATNVILASGNRATGTRVSAEVYDKVLENNTSFYDRAFVVNDWYISAYDPILDLEGKVVGILYVGVLARKYDEIRRRLWQIYGGLSVVAGLLVVLVGAVFARRLTSAVHGLAEASSSIAGGEFSLRVPEPRQNDELKDLTKAFNFMAESLHDRDERLEKVRQELERTNAALNQVNQNYLDMLGFISHELKNTLGVIYTSARALDSGLAGPLSENQAGLIRGIARNIDTAVTMTRKYLDLTRIEKGELKLQKQPLDLRADVVEPVLEELKTALAARRMLVEDELPATAPLEGDPTLLRVVYKNLLDNAVKYGLEGGRIRLDLAREGDVFRLSVFNQGPGLSEDKIRRLFNKFVRFRSLQDPGHKGTGLGLFITREIVLKHGGDIRAESEEGRWMRFVFTLPAKTV